MFIQESRVLNSKLLWTYCEEGFSVIEYALYQDRAIKSEAFSVPGALIFNLTQIMAFLKQPCHSYTCTHKKQRIADAGDSIGKCVSKD